MYRMIDYIKWRADLPFSVVPMNEADCYLISKIGVLDFSGIADKQGEVKSFRAAAEEFFMKYEEERQNTDKSSDSEFISVLRDASRSTRFGDLGLSRFVNIIDKDRTEQFSALIVTLPDETRFITFRGTDDHILAWKENFYLSCSDSVSAQRDALAYLNHHAALSDSPLILGGHSKGGNLAIFAACSAAPEIQDRIKAVYCFDGPGFHREFYNAPGYEKMRNRIFKLISEHSLIGTLLDNPENNIEIVSTEDFALKAHDGFNWETNSTGFVRAEELDKSSRIFDSSIDTVLTRMDNESRRQFIDSFFDTLDKQGASTLTELTSKGTSAYLSLAADLLNTAETRQFLSTVVSQINGDAAADKKRHKDIS